MIYYTSTRESEVNMREWRNRQTRTFEGRVGQLVRVQVPSLAPRLSRQKLAELFFYAIYKKDEGLEVGAVVNEAPVELQSRE